MEGRTGLAGEDKSCAGACTINSVWSPDRIMEGGTTDDRGVDAHEKQGAGNKDANEREKDLHVTASYHEGKGVIQKATGELSDVVSSPSRKTSKEHLESPKASSPRPDSTHPHIERSRIVSMPYDLLPRSLDRESSPCPLIDNDSGVLGESNVNRQGTSLYVDHANDPIPIPGMKGAQSSPKFPHVLHQLLSSLERQGLSHIAGFQAHGRAFAIRDQRTFLHQVMPNWFKHTKLTSFQRQLNLYDFRRVSRGPEAGAYWHPMFLRGQEALTIQMQRIKGRRVTNASAPNFWDFPPVIGENILVDYQGCTAARQDLPYAVLQPMTVGQTTPRQTKHSNASARHGFGEEEFYKPSTMMTGSTIMTSPLVRGSCKR